MIKRWTLYFTLLLVVSNGLDILSTYYATPDLSEEANPVVTAMGSSWFAVFIIKGVFVLVLPIVCFLSLRTLGNRSKRLAGKKGFSEVYNHLVYKRHKAPSELWVLPEDWGALIAMIGIAACVAGVFAINAVIANMFHLVRSQMHLLIFFFATGILSITSSVYLIYRFLINMIQTEHRDAEPRLRRA